MVGRRTRKRRPSKVKMPKEPGPNQCHPRVGKTPVNGCIPLEVISRTLGGSRKVSNSSGSGTASATANASATAKIAKKLGVDPKNQRSLLNALPLPEKEKEELAKKWLRPAMPAAWKDDPDMWLDSNNIRDVMKQYEEAHPDFKFLGPYPIDFAARDPYETSQKKCLVNEMCSLDLDGKELEGKDYIGIVYNLDPHYKGGSHWVANYIDIPNKSCYYFDSYGMAPPKQIEKFMQWLTIQEPAMKLGWNGRRFQRSDTECGMYCLYFLDRMLAKEPFLKFCRRAPPDRFMLDMRDWMFST